VDQACKKRVQAAWNWLVEFNPLYEGYGAFQEFDEMDYEQEHAELDPQQLMVNSIIYILDMVARGGNGRKQRG
jgi:hypothetical protein